jgi:hypothetical protein
VSSEAGIRMESALRMSPTNRLNAGRKLFSWSHACQYDDHWNENSVCSNALLLSPSTQVGDGGDSRQPRETGKCEECNVISIHPSPASKILSLSFILSPGVFRKTEWDKRGCFIGTDIPTANKLKEFVHPSPS